MKKILLSILTIGSLFAVSAAEYSSKEYSSLKTFKQQTQYAYNSTISRDSKTDVCHMIAYLSHVKKLKKSNLTIQQINEAAKIFKDFGYYKTFLYEAYIKNGHIELVENKIRQDKSGLMMSVVYERLLDQYIVLKNKEKIWQIGSELLLNDGIGIKNTKVATSALNSVLRYKPKTVTKQQQIAFLEQIAQIYPIPGTDFNDWKAFMGLVGFKYKALTGKELF